MARPPHFEDADVRIDKLVVGPFENNVFVVRDKATGEAVRDAGIDVGIAAEDASMLPGYDFTIPDDDVVAVGSLRLRTIHTPGHTPGSTCFLLEGKPVLFSGDTLFPGGVGNTSLAGGDFGKIIESVDRRLFTLPADLLVLPGHGLDTTIGDEAPHLQEWVDRGW